MADRVLQLKLLSDVTSINKGIGEVNSKLSGMTSALKGVAAGFVAAFAVGEVIDFGAKSITMASDLTEALSKVDVVFGENASAIKGWSKTASEAMGMTETDALKSAGTLGNLFDAMGIGADQTKEYSTQLVQLAADLASFNNSSVDEAMTALMSGMLGETEPMRRFGADLSAVNVQMKAQAMGLGEMVKQGSAFTYFLTDAEKIQARYALIMDKTTNAQGDFARTQEGLANSTKTLSTKFAEFQTAIGMAMLPAMQGLARLLLDELIPALAGIWQQVGPGLQQLVETMGPMLSGAVAKLMALWTALQPAIAGLAAVIQPLIDGALTNLKIMFDNVMLVIDAIIAILNGDFTGAWNAITGVVDNVVIMVQNSIAAFLGFLGNIAPTFRQVAENIGNAIFNGIAAGVNAVVGVVRSVINEVIKALNSINDFAWDRQGFEVNTIAGNFFVGVGAGSIKMWPDIPMLAKGGIVNSPTLAMIGEAGPEAVVPLGSGGGMGTTINVYVTVGPTTDMASVGAAITKALKAYKNGGGGPAIAAAVG